MNKQQGNKSGIAGFTSANKKPVYAASIAKGSGGLGMVEFGVNVKPDTFFSRPPKIPQSGSANLADHATLYGGPHAIFQPPKALQPGQTNLAGRASPYGDLNPISQPPRALQPGLTKLAGHTNPQSGRNYGPSNNLSYESSKPYRS